MATGFFPTSFDRHFFSTRLCIRVKSHVTIKEYDMDNRQEQTMA